MNNLWVQILVFGGISFLVRAVIVPAIFGNHDKAVTPAISHLTPSRPLTSTPPSAYPSYYPPSIEPRHQTSIPEPSYPSQEPAPNYQDDTQRFLQQEAERSQQQQLQNARTLCNEYYEQSLSQAESGGSYASSSVMMIFQCNMVESESDVSLRTLRVNLAGAKHLCEEYTAKMQGDPSAVNAAMQTSYCIQADQYEAFIVQLQLRIQQEALQQQSSN